MPNDKRPRDKEIESHAEPAAEEASPEHPANPPPPARLSPPKASSPTAPDQPLPSAASQGELLEPAGGGTHPGDNAKKSSKGTAKQADDDQDEEAETAGTPRLESDKFAAPKKRSDS